jgi:hypothetical protein
MFRYENGIGPAAATALDPNSIELIAAFARETFIIVKPRIRMARRGDTSQLSDVGLAPQSHRIRLGRRACHSLFERDSQIHQLKPQRLGHSHAFRIIGIQF